MHGGSDVTRGPVPPDGGWGWVVVFASFMIHVIADGVAYTFGIFFVEILNEFHESKSSTSAIASLLAGMTYGAGPFAAAFVNKWGCRPVSMVGSILAALGFALSYFATGIYQLYVTIGLMGGFGLGLIYLPAIVSVTCYFEQRRAFATGIAVCGSGVGTFILAPVMAILIREYQWRLALVFTAMILLLCFFFSLLFKPLPESPSPQQKLTHPESPVVSLFRARKPSDQLGSADPNSPFPLAGFEQRESAEPLLSPHRHGQLANNRKGSRVDSLTLSASHPILPVVNIGDSRHQPMRRHSFRGGSAPYFSSAHLITNREDIFYSGSVTALNRPGIEEPQLTEEVKEKPEWWSPLCPPELLSVFKRMMDFSILKNPVFLFFGISNFLTSLGYNVPFIYIADLAVEGQNDKSSSGFLLSIIGISNTLSRIVLGYLSDKPCVNRLYLYNSALTISGIATGLVSHTTRIEWLRVYAVVFGVTIGCFVSLTSVLLVDLLGLEKLTNAFGLLLLFQGAATLIGPPIVGKLFDVLHNYRVGFWLVGGMMSLSGAMLFLIPILQRRRSPLTKNEEKVPEIKIKRDSEDKVPSMTKAEEPVGVLVEIKTSDPPVVIPGLQKE